MTLKLEVDKLSARGEWSVDFDSTRLVFGSGALRQLGDLTEELGCRRVLLVTDRGLRDAGHLDSALDSLSRRSIEARVYDGATRNPTTRHVAEAVEAAGTDADGIVGLGGGSAMDCARAANFLLTGGGRMEDYWGTGKAKAPMLPSVGIPTTAGTGSDAQSYALISQEETKVKMACGDRRAKFRAVILDPALTATTPRDVAALSGIDAVSHVVESYVCTRRNPISQLLGREAWRRIDRSLALALGGGEDETPRADMLLAAHLAGAAIEHSMLGAAHACANPLTTRYDVVHGAAVATMLPHVMDFNRAVVADEYDALAGAAEGRAAGDLRARVVGLMRLAGLDRTLSDHGVARDDLPGLAGDAAAQWTAGFNPRSVGCAELQGLYEAAW
ncbi:MAG: iron-containing alcohol dehydrogenase [bacterium]|nr:iron-containing alcohol dehydrogenase [bacterium]